MLYSSLPLMLVLLAQQISSLPIGTSGSSSVHVSFSSPSQSYQHGHNILQGSGVHHDSQVLVSPPVTGYPPSLRVISHARSLHQLNPAEEILPESSALEISPILDETLIQDIEPTGATLQDLIARFAHNPPAFFSTFPHQRSLLANIELRHSQHLPDLRLGSIRPGSPFLRA